MCSLALFYHILFPFFWVPCSWAIPRWIPFCIYTCPVTRTVPRACSRKRPGEMKWTKIPTAPSSQDRSCVFFTRKEVAVSRMMTQSYFSTMTKICFFKKNVLVVSFQSISYYFNFGFLCNRRPNCILQASFTDVSHHRQQLISRISEQGTLWRHT